MSKKQAPKNFMNNLPLYIKKWGKDQKYRHTKELDLASIDGLEFLGYHPLTEGYNPELYWKGPYRVIATTPKSLFLVLKEYVQAGYEVTPRGDSFAAEKKKNEHESTYVPIKEVFSWAPLHPEPGAYKKVLQFAGITSRKDYYYQDGRPSFHDWHLRMLYRILENYTTADMSTYKYEDSGPRVVDAVADVMGENKPVPSKPNWLNGVVAVDKLRRSVAGEDVTYTKEEVEAGINALNDDKGREHLDNYVAGKKKK